MDKGIEERLAKLEDKYAAMGQDMVSYLDGLIHADYLTYWDYINLDVLLNLQQPKTPIEDEEIFVIYHQITELYFKLILKAIYSICDTSNISADEMIKYLKRCNMYFKQLVDSFDIVVDGMDHQQFLKFRMSLLPASGFQSVQYRMIEICATDINHLVHHTSRQQLAKNEDVNELYKYLYWKRGATELATGKKTLTLKQFEEKYGHQLIHLIRDFYHKNIWEKYLQLSPEDKKHEGLVYEMRYFDFQANVLWPLSHFRAAARHLDRDESEIAATGGTNWQKYLPPKNQRVVFYPELWTDEEIDKWGRKIKFSQN